MPPRARARLPTRSRGNSWYAGGVQVKLEDLAFRPPFDFPPFSLVKTPTVNSEPSSDHTYGLVPLDLVRFFSPTSLLADLYCCSRRLPANTFQSEPELLSTRLSSSLLSSSVTTCLDASMSTPSSPIFESMFSLASLLRMSPSPSS